MGGISDRAKGYILGNDLLMGVGFLVVASRFYCRIRTGTKRGLWWDDLFILLAYLFAIGFGACVNVAMAHYGWDQHIGNISLHVLSASAKSYMIAKILFVLSGTCVRMALLLFYLWLIKDVSEKGIKRVIYIVMILNGALCLAGVFISIFQCWPVRAVWTWEIKAKARCINEPVAITTLGALLSAADLIVNVLPLPIVARLNVPLHQRIAATLLLSLGTIATAAGVVREVYIYRAFIGSNDPTWNSLPLWICADVEIYIGLLCACVPSLRPAWTKVSSWFSCWSCRNRTLAAPRGSHSQKSAGELQVPNSMSWQDFDKDVVFDGTSSFHSASYLWGRKKSHTTSVATRLGTSSEARSHFDSFFHSKNRDGEDHTLQDLEAGPKDVHVRHSIRLQTQTF